MISPAPYTPSTIARIKQLVRTMPAADIATELGWSLNDLKTRCKRHNIELVVHVPIDDAAATPKTPPLRIGPVLDEAGLTWNDASGELAGRACIMTLPRLQARIFGILVKAQGRPLGGAEIAELCGCSRPPVVNTIGIINTKLRAFGIRIDSNRGSGSGYRLALAANTSPASGQGDSPASDTPADSPVNPHHCP